MNTIQHKHKWYKVDRDISDEQGNDVDIEVIYWCEDCLATKDSNGGVIA